jgi:hypothetical protein
VLGELIVHYVEYFEAKDPNHPFIRVIASREQLKRSTGNWAIDRDGWLRESGEPDRGQRLSQHMNVSETTK